MAKPASSKPKASSGAPWSSSPLPPTGFGVERGGWPSNLDGQGWGGSGEAGAREDAAQEPRAEMLAASRRAPLAADQVWGNPSRFTGPRGRKSRRHFSHSCPQTPTLEGVGGMGKDAGSTFPVTELSPKTFPARPRGEGEAEAPGEARHSRGTRGARWGLTSPRGARSCGGGSEARRGGPRAAAAAGGAAAVHGPRGAPAEKPQRDSPVRAAPAPAPAPALAPAPAWAAAGAALSRQRALWPSTGEVRLGGPTPACRFAPPGGVPCDVYMR